MDRQNRRERVPPADWHFEPARPLLSAHFPGSLQLLVARPANIHGPSFEFILGRHVADGAVQTRVVAMGDELGHDRPRLLEVQRRPRPDGLLLERAVPVLVRSAQCRTKSTT
ncbi:MAG: hypothetical protein DVB23_003380 [Verrucomicrobia bacterium]|nr:MAG: hypothetical protein DVB23_003380 [Verrucomicrobiota bacterium]